MSIYDNRISQLQSAMATRGVDMVVLAPTNHMKYLSGWCESGHERLLAMFVPATGNPIFVVPSLNAEQCKTNPAGFTDVRGWNDSTGWHEVVRPILSGNKFCIDDELDSVHLMGFQSIAPNAKYDPATPLVSVLREIKSADEIELMMATAAVTDTVFANSVSQLNAGMTEKEFEAIITAEYAKFGTRPQFSIIGFGPNGALPHHHTGSRTLQSGDVIIIDIGCELAGYQSDITRTVAFGEPSNEAKKVYSVVHGAFLAAMNFARPGVTCESVDKASRDVIDAAGYGEYFIHRTGHGIGLSGHEEPYIVQGNKRVLEPCMCFSIEPGIYLQGKFGVRIENIVHVVDDGVKSENVMPSSDLMVVS